MSLDDRRKRNIWSLRRLLISVHEDLLRIHENVEARYGYLPNHLTELEKRIIILEDRTFFSHKGVDKSAIFRELIRFLTLRKVRGASTIDMQFVRTCTQRYERTFKRKVYEAILASIIQFRYSKVDILRSYMGIAYLGWDLRGFSSTAIKEFGTSTYDIDGLDAAKLAAHLVFPKPKHPTTEWSRKVLRRANYIESRYISHKKRFNEINSSEFIE